MPVWATRQSVQGKGAWNSDKGYTYVVFEVRNQLQDVDNLEDKLLREEREEGKTEEEGNRGPLYRPSRPVHDSLHSHHCAEYDSCTAAIAQPLCNYCTAIAQSLRSDYKQADYKQTDYKQDIGKTCRNKEKQIEIN